MASFARALAFELAASGVAVLSGGAKGIDTEAHLGALDAGGVTMVVAPSSFDRCYPAENRTLFDRIVRSNGAFLSEYEHGVLPMRPHFFARNGLLAALCQVLVVVESRIRGGGRNAAKWARELGRPVFAVPTVPWSSSGVGCLEELKLGARVLTSSKDVLEALAAQNAHPVLRAAPTARSFRQSELPWGASPSPACVPESRGDAAISSARPDVERLLSALEFGLRHPDELCRITGLSAGRMQELILTLTLEGILVSHPSGYVSKVNTGIL